MPCGRTPATMPSSSSTSAGGWRLRRASSGMTSASDARGRGGRWRTARAPPPTPSRSRRGAPPQRPPRDAPPTPARPSRRTRIRHELLPLLARDYNPNIKGALAQLAEQSRTDYDFLDEEAGRSWKRTVKSANGDGRTLAISVAAFLRQPQALQRQLMRRAIQRVKGEPGRLEYRHWLEAERLFRERPSGTLLDLPGGVQLRREPEHVVLRRSCLNLG